MPIYPSCNSRQVKELSTKIQLRELMSFGDLPTRVWWVGRLLRQVERWSREPHHWGAHLSLDDEPQNLHPWRSLKNSQAVKLVPGLLTSAVVFICVTLGRGFVSLLSFPFSLRFGLVFESLEHLSFQECVYWATFFLGGGVFQFGRNCYTTKSRGSMLRSVCIPDIGKTLPGSTDWREDQYFCGVLVYLLRRLVLTSKRWSGCLGYLDCWLYSPAQGTPSHFNFSCCDIPS